MHRYLDNCSWLPCRCPKWAHIYCLCFFHHFEGSVKAIFQKKIEILKNREKRLASETKGCKKSKIFEKSGVFFKIQTLSSWILILRVFSFLLRYRTWVLLKFFKFSSFWAMKFTSKTNFILWPVVKKIIIRGDCFWYLWTARDQSIYFRSSFIIQVAYQLRFLS